jgi:nitroimidazol reductase NimA-like FMN-containing flavoprotein (pyridoxamine 5'-phosphate oxidase superfamily)
MLGILTKDQIAHVLQTEVVGRIGCYDGKEVYIVPVTFVYRDGYVYAHSKEGRKVQVMRKNPDVCFQVDAVDNMANWRSVIAWGKYEELVGEKEQKEGMKILIDRLTPLLTSETVRPTHGLSRPPEVLEKGLRPVAYRIKITRSSGRFEKALYGETENHQDK